MQREEGPKEGREKKKRVEVKETRKKRRKNRIEEVKERLRGGVNRKKDV